MFNFYLRLDSFTFHLPLYSVVAMADAAKVTTT